MPELPEVHTTATILDKLVKNLRVSEVWTDYLNKNKKGEIKNPEYFEYFKKKITGTKIKKVHRRAKNILFDLDNGFTILAHMKMTGHFLYGKYEKDAKWIPIEPKELKDSYNRFIHFVISFSNGKHLTLSDMRKFAKITLIETESAEKNIHLENLGPEPLSPDFDFKTFKKSLRGKSGGKIKTVLMNQNIISGIGNIYSDEVLWFAGVHPESKTSKIPEIRLRKIFIGIKTILEKGIKFGGDSMSDYRNPHGKKGNFHYHHRAYKKKGEKCEKKGCLGIINRILVGARSSHFCPKHQIKY